jgi:hypothetical protein
LCSVLLNDVRFGTNPENAGGVKRAGYKTTAAARSFSYAYAKGAIFRVQHCIFAFIGSIRAFLVAILPP